MGDAFLSCIAVEIGRLIRPVSRQIEEEVAQGLFVFPYIVDDGVDFGAVARRQDDGFAQAAVVVEVLKAAADASGVMANCSRMATGTVLWLSPTMTKSMA